MKRIILPSVILVIACAALFLANLSYATDARYKITANIAYAQIPGANERLTSLDIYVPQDGNNYPVVVFIHGGAWRMGDKARHKAKAIALAKKGYVFVNLNYRLAPKVKFPVYAQDVASATAWVYRNIEKYGGDAKRIFIMGHSAGAHLAALVASDEKYLKGQGLDLNILRGAILLDATGIDLLEIKRLKARSFHSIYYPAFGDDPIILSEASVVSHISADKGIPEFLIFYTLKKDTFKLQAQALMDALKSARIPFEVFSVPGDSHNSLSSDFGNPDDSETVKAYEFLGRLQQ